jgi:UDP-glucuronate decarboxylase
VDDLVEGLIRLMNADRLHDPVNLGNPGEFSIHQLAEVIAELCGTRLVVEHRPLPQDDPTQRRPDISRARQLLGWHPSIALRQGLERTVPYFAERLKRSSTRQAKHNGRLVTAGDIPFVERRRAYTEARNWMEG